MIFSSTETAVSKYTSSLPTPGARRINFIAELLPGVCLEIGGVAPELILLERLGVVQPHDQRGVDLMQKSGEVISHQHRRELPPAPFVRSSSTWQRPTGFPWRSAAVGKDRAPPASAA